LVVTVFIVISHFLQRSAMTAAWGSKHFIISSL